MSDTPLPVGSITGDPSVLHSSNAPPLILVFLASGLLVGAVLSILVLRHMYPNRFAGRTTPLRQRKMRQPIGERPTLWDVYGCNEGIADTRWRSMQPLAAAFLADPEDSAVEQTPPSSSPLTHRPHPWPWVDWLLQTFRRDRQQSAHDDPEQTSAGKEEPPSLGRLQIAVIIAMPSRQSSARGSWACPEKQGETSTCDLEEERDLCIGLVELLDVPQCFGQVVEAGRR
ncbi:hypothetical protein DAEQUDRAFT_726044 [Daedalea quercina L-15889]|uniref:Uncharacterized protein n=1 Tax=Daedalea quercina L-15889 TaxID=1314783 RepID=A0A165QXB6_9APHY|nr:hypothetical protein DAEQUDRAFT_726044 [Daedalea quercina L-15889]